MRVFLTGATGVIGRRVVPLLLDAGHTVTAIARTPAKRAALQHQGASAVDADMLEPQSLRRVVDGHEVVVNLATHMPSSSVRMLLRGSWRENDLLRREGSRNLVDAALVGGAHRFIQESFAPVYEDGGEAWITEDWPLRPAPYNRTVLDAEASARRFAESRRDGAGVILRFSAFYGADSRVLHEMVRTLRRGWSPLPGREEAFISSISHDDAAAAVVAALAAPSGAYNVTDDEPMRRREWVDTLADALEIRRPRWLPRWVMRLGGSTMELIGRSQRMSNARFRTATEWAPKWPSVREGWAAQASS